MNPQKIWKDGSPWLPTWLPMGSHDNSLIHKDIMGYGSPSPHISLYRDYNINIEEWPHIPPTGVWACVGVWEPQVSLQGVGSRGDGEPNDDYMFEINELVFFSGEPCG